MFLTVPAMCCRPSDTGPTLVIVAVKVWLGCSGLATSLTVHAAASAAGGLKNSTSNGDFSVGRRILASAMSQASGARVTPRFESVQSSRMFWAFRSGSLFWTSPTTWRTLNFGSVQRERLELTIWTSGGGVTTASAVEGLMMPVEIGKTRVSTVSAPARNFPPPLAEGRVGVFGSFFPGLVRLLVSGRRELPTRPVGT